MAQLLRVAAAQMGPVQRGEDREAVLERLLALMRQAHERGCRLVVYPELALTTFFPRYLIEDSEELHGYFESAMPGPGNRVLFETAKTLGIGFYLGYAERCEDDGAEHFYNSAVLVDERGQILGNYRKVHLPGTQEPVAGAPFQHLEKRYFEVGNYGFPVWPAFGARMGMCICNDRRWPETYRVMALKGVQMVLCGYNTPDTNIHHPEPKHLRMFHNELSVQAGAYQNGIWVVATAKAGLEDGFGMIGGSCIAAPTGEIVARALGEEDEVLVYDCDLSKGDYIRRTVFDFARHRRIEHYGIITAQTGVVCEDPP